MSECKCVTRHSPSNPPLEGHHYPPTSYTLKPGGQRLVIRMCSNAHGIQHKLLNLQREKGADYFPRGVTAYHRTISEYTWANTDRSKPIPRTLSHD